MLLYRDYVSEINPMGVSWTELIPVIKKTFEFFKSYLLKLLLISFSSSGTQYLTEVTNSQVFNFRLNTIYEKFSKL